MQGSDGNLYGTTALGGTNGAGTVFKITTNGALTSLYSFTGGNDGNEPQAQLVQGNDGNLYGTTSLGGTNGAGTVFRITTSGTLISLYSFTGGNDGGDSLAGLMQASDGNFYSTTPGGNVFRLEVIEQPVLSSLTLTGDTLSFIWRTIAGQTNQVQYKTNLIQTDWNNLGNAITATNSTLTFSTPIGPDSQRFYRVVLLP